MRQTSNTTTNTAAPDTSRALIRWAIDGEACDIHRPVVLAAGIDTLYFSFDVEVSEELWAKLEEERLIAQMLMQERKAVHCPEWLNAQISPSGAKGGYRFLLETPFFSNKLLRGVPHRPPIFVEMRAFGLHTHTRAAKKRHMRRPAPTSATCCSATRIQNGRRRPSHSTPRAARRGVA